MICLVTGAAGFIGSNLCHHLLYKGHEVIGLDNFSTGNKNNLFHIKKHNKFKFIHGDIRKTKDCNSATSGVDIVFHQAALGSVPRSIKDPIKTNEVNIDGFLKILEASKKNEVKRIIYAASSSTYGDSNVLPKTEENIGKPLSPYAVTKYVNELYADVYSKTFDMDLIGLRYFNVFGRRQDPNGTYAAVIPKFIALFLKGESPVIYGDGSYSRDFTYIDNVLQMNYLAMKTKSPEAVNQIYNTAAGDRITIKKMTETIREELSRYKSDILNIPIEFGPKRLGDIPHSEANIEKSKNLLGYKPIYNFYDGIKSYIKWYMEESLNI
jgi:UDP-N-acetylglucosamine/UDP-N-acetylgalactosamine 4-epimerase